MNRKSLHRIWAVFLGFVLSVSLVSCGGGGGGGGSPGAGSSGSPTPTAKATITDANGNATINNAEGGSIQVQVTDEANTPLSGISVMYDSHISSVPGGSQKILILFDDPNNHFAPAVYFDNPATPGAITVAMPTQESYTPYNFNNQIRRAKSYMADTSKQSQPIELSCSNAESIVSVDNPLAVHLPRLLILYDSSTGKPSAVFIVDTNSGFQDGLIDYLADRLAEASISRDWDLGVDVASRWISVEHAFPAASIFETQVEFMQATPGLCGLDPGLYGIWRYQSYNGFDRSQIGITLTFRTSMSNYGYRLNNPLRPCAEEGGYRIDGEGSRKNAQGAWIGGGAIAFTPGFNQDCSLEGLFDFTPPIGYTVSGSTLEFRFQVNGAPVTAVFKRES